MKSVFILLLLAFAISCTNNNTKNTKLWPAHAHNDYEHEHPLSDAMACNFRSIEADVFSVGDSLFVAHNFEDIQPGRTLRNLYLDPLQKQINQNSNEIILLVDFKNNGLRTYQLLDSILGNYSSILKTYENGECNAGKVMVVVSGDRPLEYMQSQNKRFAFYDGRLSDIDSDLSPAIMPMVSDSWSSYFSWDGNGEMPANEKAMLKTFADKAKQKGYILRFWGTPNKTAAQRKAVWTELNNAGVGLIGTDNLKELEEFFEKSTL